MSIDDWREMTGYMLGCDPSEPNIFKEPQAMTTRAEEIAAEGPYTYTWNEVVKRFIIDGPTHCKHLGWVDEPMTDIVCEDLNRAYKQGQQDNLAYEQSLRDEIERLRKIIGPDKPQSSSPVMTSPATN